MKLVARNRAAALPQNARHQKVRPPVSQVKLARREACLKPQKPQHSVPFAFRIDQAVAQHHVASALAVNGLRCREGAHARDEVGVGGEPLRMKFGVTAG